MKLIAQTFLLAAVSTVLAACMPNISSDQVQAGNANQVTQTVAGRIISMQATTVTGNEDNKVGMLGGAAIGGIAGSALGGGTRMNMLGAVGGAMLGGMVGNAIEGKLTTQQGMQYTIKMPTGNLLTVVQGVSPVYSMGQCVLLVEGPHGRITGVADESVCATIPVTRYRHAVAVQKVYVED
jgi:outer membrane lipoprotein SlyB